jgi:hypothetical protein
VSRWWCGPGRRGLCCARWGGASPLPPDRPGMAVLPRSGNPNVPGCQALQVSALCTSSTTWTTLRCQRDRLISPSTVTTCRRR